MRRRGRSAHSRMEDRPMPRRRRALIVIVAATTLSGCGAGHAASNGWPTGCRVINGQPDPRCTPGAVDHAATLATICHRGYARGVRPRRRTARTLKQAALAAYGLPPSSAALLVLDHLIPLSLGGASSPANLWPQIRW